MDLTKKLKMAMAYQNINQLKLAELSGQRQNNLSQKMITNNYKLSEYQKLVEALGCQLEINIVLPNGEKV